MRRSLPLCLALVLLILPQPLLGDGLPPRQAAIHPSVEEALASGGEVEVLVVLRAQADLGGTSALPTKEARGRYVYEQLKTVAGESQRELRATLDAEGIEYQSFLIVNAIKVRSGSALIHSLAARDDVARIELNPRVQGVPSTPLPSASASALPGLPAAAPHGIESNLLHVNADDVWALGYTGQGIVVAGQDTGYDWDHPALKNQYRGWDGSAADHDCNWHDAIHDGGGVCGPNSTQPCDDHGHGTHTMGTLVGDDGGDNQIGMAPGAHWIGCRNMDEGVGTPATYLECFEFFLAPYPLGGTPEQGIPELAPHVVNNSWSCPPDEGCDAGTLEAAVEALRQAGIVVVASTGNQGPSCGTVEDPPAIYPSSFSVGALDHNTGQIASFSSRGPVTYGGETFIKPDITAPGVSVRSSLRGGSYGSKSGTSMAAPHIAGAVALLLSAAPSYDGRVSAVEEVLTHTAKPRTTAQGCGGDGPADVPNNVWGWGILDALAAVRQATEEGWLQGTVTNAENGFPLSGATVTAYLVSGAAQWQTLADTTGYYTLTLTANTYDLTVQADGYMPQTVPNVAVLSDQVTTHDFALVLPRRAYLPLIYKNLSD